MLLASYDETIVLSLIVSRYLFLAPALLLLSRGNRRETGQEERERAVAPHPSERQGPTWFAPHLSPSPYLAP